MQRLLKNSKVTNPVLSLHLLIISNSYQTVIKVFNTQAKAKIFLKDAKMSSWSDAKYKIESFYSKAETESELKADIAKHFPKASSITILDKIKNPTNPVTKTSANPRNWYVVDKKGKAVGTPFHTESDAQEKADKLNEGKGKEEYFVISVGSYDNGMKTTTKQNPKTFKDAYSKKQLLTSTKDYLTRIAKGVEFYNRIYPLQVAISHTADIEGLSESQVESIYNRYKRNKKNPSFKETGSGKEHTGHITEKLNVSGSMLTALNQLKAKVGDVVEVTWKGKKFLWLKSSQGWNKVMKNTNKDYPFKTIGGNKPTFKEYDKVILHTKGTEIPYQWIEGKWRYYGDDKPLTTAQLLKKSGTIKKARNTSKVKNAGDSDSLVLSLISTNRMLKDDLKRIYKNISWRKKEGRMYHNYGMKILREFVERIDKQYGFREVDYRNVAEILLNDFDKMSNPKIKKNFTNADFKTHQKKRLVELSKMFQGTANGMRTRVLEPDIAPKNKYRLGYLAQMIIRQNGKKTVVNFDGESYLAGDLRNNLWITGKDARITNIKKPAKNHLKVLGDLVQIDYVTTKSHIENGKNVRFYHKLGEVDKEHPKLAIDYDGFPVILGGGYDVWNVGIVN